MNYLQQFFTKKKLYIGIPCAILTLSILFAIPHFAHAGFLDVVTSPLWLLSVIIQAIAYVINFILGIFLMFASFLVDIAMSFNADILSKHNTLIEVGWHITRDIANLGFVIAIIIMAFATIIRIESYGAQKLLTKLIIAAILVNFSLAIPGMLITFTNSITNFFLEGSNTTSFSIGTMIAGAFNPQRLSLTLEDPPPPDPSESGGGGFTTAALMSIANLLFGATFILIATIVLFILAIMFMIRYIALSFLLVLAPLTWFFWIIPDLQTHFTKWWSTFFKWAFFGPASSFFIYLAMQSIKGLGERTMEIPSGGLGPIEGIVKQGGQMAILTGILLAGIMIAEKMGLEGGKAAVGAAKAGSAAAAKWVGKGSAKVGGKAFGGLGKLGSGLDQKLEGWGTSGATGFKGMLGKGYVKTKEGAKSASKATKESKVGRWTGKGKEMFMNAAKASGIDEFGKIKTLGGNVWKGMKEGSGLFEKEEKKELPSTTKEITGEVGKINAQIAKVEKRTDEESKKKLKELNGRKNQLLAQYTKIKEEEVLSAEDPLDKIDKDIDELKKKMDKEKRIKGLESKSIRTDEENEELKSFNALSKEEKEKQIPKAGEAEIFERMKSLQGKLYDQEEKVKKAEIKSELNNLNRKIAAIETIPEKERTDQHKTDLEKHVSRVQEIKQAQGEQKSTNSKNFGFVIPKSSTTQQSPKLNNEQIEKTGLTHEDNPNVVLSDN